MSKDEVKEIVPIEETQEPSAETIAAANRYREAIEEAFDNQDIDLGSRNNFLSLKDRAELDNWRVDIDHRTRFSERAKVTFLQQLAIHGKKRMAATAAGVSLNTVKNHEKKDEQFAEAIHQVLEMRSEQITAHIENQAINGMTEPIVGRDNEVVGYRTRYEQQLRMAVLRRHDPNYNDKRQLDVTVKTGVLVAPGGTDLDKWLAAGKETHDKQVKQVEETRKALKPGAKVVEAEVVEEKDDSK